MTIVKSSVRENITKYKPFKTDQILVALKLSPSDEVILNYLRFFSEELPIRAIRFLHVLPSLDLYSAIYEREAQSLISNFELDQNAIKQMQNEAYAQLNLDQLPKVEFEVRTGNPLEELLNDSKEVEADLLVIGQKNAASLHGILARNLARKAPANALVIPEASKVRLKKVLVPIDFSFHSINALKAVLTINEQLEEPAEITCLNVYELPNLSFYKIQRSREQFKRMVENDRQEAFAAFINQHAPEWADRIKTVLIEKDTPGVATYIKEFADAHQMDLIAIGAKGHSKVERLLIGSVTEKLLTISDQTPILVVK